ncbi:conserved hypothetical protein [Altererythrobacter sp. B11]|uniref:tetratricopeptide repeat protein n=1 Tax=Altererythrobacter sp. B11 TaxID=2060312 RepID=UPI000DC72685|nr:tetratricopeptide repeat protein [Altererythrobacter sp. B11]BBC71957.1 conserved hypothetical protein [Altererythrobacter sp. B11]
MSVTMTAALLVAQAMTVSPAFETAQLEQKDAAYEQVAAGDARAAIAQLQAELRSEPEDPALLINLGTAYRQTGDLERAAGAYRAAIDSRTRYKLELADGRWVDSRHAARQALSQLEAGGTIALR